MMIDVSITTVYSGGVLTIFFSLFLSFFFPFACKKKIFPQAQKLKKSPGEIGLIHIQIAMKMIYNVGSFLTKNVYQSFVHVVQVHDS